MPARRRTTITASLLLTAAVATAGTLGAGPAAQATGTTTATVSWQGEVRSGQPVALSVDISGTPTVGTTVTVSAPGLRLDALPDQCAVATSVRRSSISADAQQLTCVVATGGAIRLQVTGRVTAAAGQPVTATLAVDGLSATSGPQTVLAGTAPAGRRLRLVSSPDFLNADVGRLGDGPANWTPARPQRATNSSYEHSLASVLDDWVGLQPDGVLVAGDLVDGRWDVDSDRTGIFGPLRNPRQKAAAVRRAAATFYPQWLQRFTDRGLSVFPAIGDHEIGDNPWPKAKRVLVETFKKQYERFITRPTSPATASRPTGPASGTAYAFRPVPEVQIVSVDVFDADNKRVRVGVDRRQQAWLDAVLTQAQADGVRWTIVQGHTPVLEPTRHRGSSQLHVRGGADSPLWQTLVAHGVDLYLDGEVHDVTMTSSGGVTQLAHGGLFQFGLTTYAVLDVYDDHIEVDLRDYDVRVDRSSRLWETREPGMPRNVEVRGAPYTVGTAVLDHDGVRSSSGMLRPWDGRGPTRS